MIQDTNGNTYYKVGLHTHTTLSDGRKSPEEAVAMYKEHGYDAIAVTDHWRFYESGILNGVTILSGCEYHIGNSDTAEGVMHIVGLGMTCEPTLSRDATAQQIIDGIHLCGGMAVLAHPYWSLNTPEQVLPLHGFDATEIYNSVSGVNQSFRPESGYFVDMMANRGWFRPLLATDDVHYYAPGEDACRSFVMVNAESNTPEALLAAIADGRFYASQGPHLQVTFDGHTVCVDCSPADCIAFVTNSAWAKRVCREPGTTHAEYTPAPHEKWVRVEITCGNDRAWSNIFPIQR